MSVARLSQRLDLSVAEALDDRLVRLIGVPRVRISPSPFLACLTALLELGRSLGSLSQADAYRASQRGR
jgi:hypothetical protein